MGVSYSPLFGVGLEFSDQYEVEEFLNSNGYESTEEDKEYYGFSESFRSLPSDFNVQCLNLYSGYGYAIYLSVSLRDLNKVPENIEQANRVWNRFFKKEPEIIHTVRVS